MNAKSLKNLKPGDKIKFKKGLMNAGCRATVIRIVPGKEAFPITGRLDDVIEYEFSGKRKIATRDRFTVS